jgi:hypothetical protein
MKSETLIRDSKNPSGPIIRVTRAAWDAFTEGIVNGKF